MHVICTYIVYYTISLCNMLNGDDKVNERVQEWHFELKRHQDT